MITRLVQALMGAEADEVRGGEYGARSDERTAAATPEQEVTLPAITAYSPTQDHAETDSNTTSPRATQGNSPHSLGTGHGCPSSCDARLIILRPGTGQRRHQRRAPLSANPGRHLSDGRGPNVDSVYRRPRCSASMQEAKLATSRQARPGLK